MLSYQHAYHAGCPADVHKHAVLARLLVRLAAKDEPLTMIETNAGRGLYDLASPEAKKTGEAAQGIVRLLADGQLPPAHPLAKVIKALRLKHGATAYPGSPKLAHMLLRPTDQIHLMELHPQEHAALERLMGQEPNVHIRRQDGFQGALDLCPPTPRRGLVLVDPSYEVKSEYAATAEFVLRLHRKWPEAIVMLWYPLLKAGNHLPMAETLEKAKLKGFHRREMLFAKPEAVRGMYGSGLIFVNLPDAFAAVVDAFAWPYGQA